MNRETWLAERRKALGGSDAAGIFSLPPYHCATKLWFDKRGVPEDYPSLNRRIMEMGSRLEPIVVEDYVNETGNEVSPGAELVAHPEHSFLVANTDGRIKDANFEQRGYGVLECKSAGKDNYFKILKEGLPESYILQMQTYLHVLDLKWGAFAVLMAAAPWSFETFEVQRDEKLIKIIVDKAAAFWDTVQNGEMPERLELSDDRCKTCVYRKTCWNDKLELMEDAQAKADGAIDLGNNSVYLLAMEEYKQGKQIEKEGKAQKEDAAGKIQKLMGDEGVAVGAGSTVYYKVQTSSRCDTKALLADHPDFKDKYWKASKSRPFKVY